MKKTVGILLICVLFFALPLTGSAREETLTSGDYQYSLTAEGTALITRYLGADREAAIPQTLDGLMVTAIGEGAFRDRESLTTVQVPEGVTAIGVQAFYNCTALSSLTLPLSLTEIADLAFASCESLEEVVIPQNVSRIGVYAFGDCAKLKTVLLPPAVAEIGPDAFLETAPGFALQGFEGSFAQEYAARNGISFSVLSADLPQAQAVSTPLPQDQPEPDSQPVTEPEPAAADSPADAPPPEADSMISQFTVSSPAWDSIPGYTGDLQDGLPQGQGSFTAVYPDGASWTYEGAWDQGTMSGMGTMTWSDGLSFRGSYRDNQPVQGEWLIDGKVVYTGGFKLCAAWGATVFDGEGKLWDRAGGTIYEGSFESGLLIRTEEERAARAKALDTQTTPFALNEYAAALGAANEPGELVKLQGRVSKIITNDSHGHGEFILSNSLSGGAPLHISYRFSKDEKRPQVGSLVTVWGTAIGVYSSTDSAGSERLMPRLDAHVITLAEEKPVKGSAEATLSVNKELTGRGLKDQEFIFGLDAIVTLFEEKVDPLDGALTFVPVTSSNRLGTKANTGDGVILFDPIPYTAEDIGRVYTYTITEIPGVEADMVYDPMVLEITAVITDAGDGTPLALVFYPDDITFNNSCPSPTDSVTLEARVALQGRPLAEGEFSYLLIAGTELLQTAVNDSEGNIAFAPIDYTVEDIGQTYRYTIVENPEATVLGVEIDTLALEVAVSILDAGDSTPKASVTYPEDTTFNKQFSLKSELDLTFTAALEGREIKNGEFNFELSDGETLLQTKRNELDGTISFSPLVYSQEDIGKDYVYTVRGIPGDEPGMGYDPAGVTISVSVALGKEGLLLTVTETPEGRVFYNSYGRPDTPPLLYKVDTDKTEMTPGDTVTWTPLVSQGTKPYRYYYRLFKDGAEFKDIGWGAEATRISRLNTPGVWQMEMMVEDANGRQTQALMSREVILAQPVDTAPLDLSGIWKFTLNLVDSAYLSGKGDPGWTSRPETWTVDWQEGVSGIATSDTFGPSLALSYENGTLKATFATQGINAAYEGRLTSTEGAVTLSGDFLYTLPGVAQLTGNWTAARAE